MSRIPRNTAYRIIYWNVVAGAFLVSLSAASVVRRLHQFDVLILEAGRHHHVDPRLVSAVIWKESRFKPTALGAANEIGLMQVTEAAGVDWARANGIPAFQVEDLWNPETNIRAGTWYLARAIERWREEDCKDPLPFALAEYNAGRRNAQDWAEKSGTDPKAFVEAVQFSTTRNYIEDILTRYRGKV